MKIAILTSGGDSAGMNAVVRSIVKAGILKCVVTASPPAEILIEIVRGCETWIVREGYEGLVRGNSDEAVAVVAAENPLHSLPIDQTVALIHNLRFGDGQLLRDGVGDYTTSGRTLRGRYIVRVGWDDVRGWFSEVCKSSFALVAFPESSGREVR